MRVLVVGSLNMDLVMSVGRIVKPGETISSHGYETYFGGKGSNQAVAAAQLGADVSFIGCVGDDDFGHAIYQNFSNHNINVEGIEKRGQTGTAMIQVSEDGENAIVLVPGANHMVTVDDLERNQHLFDNCDLVLLQLEIPMKVVEHAVKMANDRNKKVMVNPAPAQKLSGEMLKQINIITPNKSELSLISGQEIRSKEDVVQASRILIKLGVNTVVTTLGEQGSVYVTTETKQVIESKKTVPVDTTGAGDAYNAGLAVAMLLDKSIPEAMEIATRVSAHVITKKGAQPPIPSLEYFLGDK